MLVLRSEKSSIDINANTDVNWFYCMQYDTKIIAAMILML